MSYSVNSKLSATHLKKLHKGGTVTLTPDIHNNNSYHDVKLEFKTKKGKNKLYKNLSQNKGTRIKLDDMDDLKIHTGDGFFDSIRSVFNSPVTKSIARVAAPFAGDVVRGLTGSNLAGNLADAGLNAYAGSGLRPAKGSGPQVMLKRTSLKKGDGFFDNLRSGASKAYNFSKRVAAHPMTKSAVKTMTPYIEDLVRRKTGSNFAGEIANQTLHSYTGEGIKMLKRGGAITSQNSYTGLGASSASNWNNPNIHSRMALVRSHRGGSFAPL